jgi:FAD/FMN-containing dehydrogenase
MKKELRAIVGSKYVIDDPKVLEAYAEDYSLSPPRMPNYIVRPKYSKEVQEVVKLANDYKTPLTPCSSAVHFHGATIPSQGGIILELSRMNRILELDERNRKVKIEPGVGWYQLQSELEKHQLMAMNPLLPHPKKSALTSHLEREPMIIAKFEYGDPLLTMEVILPNGDLFRTGSACTSGAAADPVADEVQPEGPGIDWFRLLQGAQGTMGVVTWANVKVEYLPKLNKTFFIPFQGIEEAIEPLYRIQKRMIGHECLLLNKHTLSLMLARQWPEALKNLRKRLPPWTLIVILAGGRRHPEQKIEYEEEALREIGSELSLPHISESLDGTPGVGKKLPQWLRRPWPDDRKYWKFRHKGACQDLFFHTTLEKAPILIKAIGKLASKWRYARGDLGFYVQPLEQGRACHCECNLYYNSDNPAQVDKVQKLYAETAEALLNAGAFFTRPYGILADLVYDNATSYTMALKKVKGLLDPNDIMAPGKLCF